MRTPENAVKDKIRLDLKARGAYVFSPVQTGLGASTVDLLCCYRGRFLGLEVKAEHVAAKPTPRQLLTMQVIASAGGVAACVNSFGMYLDVMKDHFGEDWI